MNSTSQKKHPTSHIDRDKRDIRRGSTLSILGFLARLCARIPFLFIAGRLYGTASYGEYVLLTAIVETTALLSTFGLKRTIFRFLKEDGSDKDNASVIRHALVLGLGLSILLVALVQLTAGYVLNFFSVIEAQPNLILLALAIPFISLTDILLSSTLSRRVMRYEIAVRSFVEPLALTILSFGFYFFGFKESGLVMAFLGAFTFASLVSAYGCSRVFNIRHVLVGPVHLPTLAHMARQSLSTCLHDLTRVLVTRIDTFAVGYFFSTSSVGLYGMAQQFLTIVEKIAMSFYPMLMPVVSAAVVQGDRHRLYAQLRSAGSRLILLQLPVLIVFYIFGETLLSFVGPEFDTAWQVLMILSVGCWINSTLQLVEIPLTYMRPSINVLSSVIAISIYLAAVTIMQSRFGFEGIALTSVSAALFANILLVTIFAKTKVGPSKNTKTLDQSPTP